MRAKKIIKIWPNIAKDFQTRQLIYSTVQFLPSKANGYHFQVLMRVSIVCFSISVYTSMRFWTSAQTHSCFGSVDFILAFSNHRGALAVFVCCCFSAEPERPYLTGSNLLSSPQPGLSTARWLSECVLCQGKTQCICVKDLTR